MHITNQIQKLDVCDRSTMIIADMPDPGRVKQKPDKTIILSDHNLRYEEITVHRVELREYIERCKSAHGPYSLITSVVITSQGGVEMIYDEGYLGANALEDARRFLIEQVGPSGIIMRSILSIRSNRNNI